MRKIRKVHKLDISTYKVLCGQEAYRSKITENDNEVTCILCIRAITGMPRRGIKKIPTCRKHIRRADTYLGLLRG